MRVGTTTSERKAEGEEGEQQQPEGGNNNDDKIERLWHKVTNKRFIMGVIALKILVLVDGLVDDVLCLPESKRPAILLSLLEANPAEREAFDIS
jgi:hypothetical protein